MHRFFFCGHIYLETRQARYRQCARFVHVLIYFGGLFSWYCLGGLLFFTKTMYMFVDCIDCFECFLTAKFFFKAFIISASGLCWEWYFPSKMAFRPGMHHVLYDVCANRTSSQEDNTTWIWGPCMYHTNLHIRYMVMIELPFRLYF